MPNLDGTGPLSKGPGTGKRRGRCRDDKKITDEKKIEQFKQENDVYIETEYRERSRRRGRFTNRFTGGFSRGKSRSR